MTREEALKQIEALRTCMIVDDAEPYVVESLNMAVEALEQEPCEDCISRQAVLNEMEIRRANGDMITAGFIKGLPPVTPQQKMGQWIEHFDESGKWYECDQCHSDWGGPVNYCPNCGAKMEGSKR